MAFAAVRPDPQTDAGHAHRHVAPRRAVAFPPLAFARGHRLAAGLARAVFIGRSVRRRHWVGKLDLGVIAFHFAVICFGAMLLFSLFSFGLDAGNFLCVAAVAFASGRQIRRRTGSPAGADAAWAGLTAGRAGRKSSSLSRSVPWAGGWQAGCSPGCNHTETGFRRASPRGISGHRSGQLPGVEICRRRAARAALLNTYIYFGKHPFWNYVNATAQTLLAPLRKIPLRAGRVDFAPVVGIVIIFFAAELAERVSGLVLCAAAALNRRSAFALGSRMITTVPAPFVHQLKASRRAIRPAAWR